MRQRRRGLDLLHKPLSGEFGLEQLERDLAIVLQVVAHLHRGHAAVTQMAEKAIAAVERGVETLGLCDHRRLDQERENCGCSSADQCPPYDTIADWAIRSACPPLEQ